MSSSPVRIQGKHRLPPIGHRLPSYLHHTSHIKSMLSIGSIKTKAEIEKNKSKKIKNIVTYKNGDPARTVHLHQLQCREPGQLKLAVINDCLAKDSAPSYYDLQLQLWTFLLASLQIESNLILWTLAPIVHPLFLRCLRQTHANHHGLHTAPTRENWLNWQ